MESVTLDKKSFSELAHLIEELQLWVESLKLASNPEIMESLKKSKEQIARGEVIDFDEL